MKGRKFTTKLLLYNLLLFFAIMLAAIAAFYFWVVRDTDQRAQQDFGTLAEKATSQFDNLVYDMDKAALQIAANPSIVSWLEKIPRQKGENYFIENPQLALEVVKLLNSFNFKKDGNARICIYNDYDDFVYSATTMTTAAGVEGFFETEDFKAVQKHFQGDNVYSMLRYPGPDVLNTSSLPSPAYFSIIREIKDYFSGTQKNGYVEIQQSVDRLDKIFGNMGSAYYAALYDRAGEMIYASPTLRQDPETMEKMAEQDPKAYPLGVSTQKRTYFARAESRELPLDLVFFRESVSFAAPLTSFIGFLIILFVTVSAVAFISERQLIIRLSRPLEELTHSVQKVNIDNLHLNLTDAAESDELQVLNEVFNKMLRHLEVAIQQKVLSQTNELKSHLFALQAQMNPHFLYNILAIINMEAEICDNQKTVQICQALSKMLKYSSSMGNGMATMGEEFDHTRNYLELMKQRYENSFEYTVQLDPELRNVQVSKLMIQPICENCFSHAFGSIEDVRRIDVKAFSEGDQWFVTVEDNGCGVSQEFLEKFKGFKEQLSLETMQDEMHSLSLGGLSLVNICMRLYLVYGENFVFTIENTGHGAVVRLGGKLLC